MDEDAPAACNGSGSTAGLAVAAEKAKMKKLCRTLFSIFSKGIVFLLLIECILIGAKHWREYGPPRETVPGTEEVYTGLISDRGRCIVDWHLFDKAPRLAESRPYIGISFDDGGGTTFWVADACEEPERANPGDRVRMETAEEKGSGLRVVTKVILLEKLSF